MRDKNARLFIDMDGTIVNFYEKEGYLTDMYRKDFFRTLKPHQNVLDAVLMFMEKYPCIPCYILSSVLAGNPNCTQEKIAWLEKHVPLSFQGYRIFVPEGHQKNKYIPNISENDILFDDYSTNLIEWERAGGRAIKAINNINGKGERWKKNTTFYQDSPEKILADIESMFS